MAKKTAGRLAGLAALAAAAYMASKGKGETKADTKADTKDTAAENNRIADARAAREEDKGAALFMSGEDERPAPTGMGAATKLLAPAKVASVSALAPAKAAAPRTSAPAYTPGGDAKRGGPTSAEKANMLDLPAPARAPGGDAKRRGADTTSTLARTPGGNAKRGGPTSEEEANIMATGGKVKKMASGGMTSQRGDGIASKGKTRCKMY